MQRVVVLLVIVGFVVAGAASLATAADDTARVLVAIDARTGKPRWELPGKPAPGNLEPWGAASASVIATNHVCGGRLLPRGAKNGWAVAGFDAATGRRTWQRTDVDAETASTGRFADGPLPVTLSGGEVGALAPDTGEVLWANAELDEPEAYNHSLLFDRHQHWIVAADRATGQQRWRWDFAAERIYGIGVDDDHVAVLLWPASKRITVPADRVVVLDAHTGAEQYQIAITPRDGRDEVAVVGSTLIVSGRRSRPSGMPLMTGYDVATGTERWHRDDELAWFASVSDAPRVYGYSPDGSGRVSAVAVRSGRTQWSMGFGEYDGHLYPVGSMVVEVDRDGSLHGRRASTGDEVWSGDAPANFRGDPVPGDGALYFGGGCDDTGEM